MLASLLALSLLFETPLVDLARSSDCIAVGQVGRIVCVAADGAESPCPERGSHAGCEEGWRIAELHVERIVAGEPSRTRLWFWATPHAPRVGEHALLFLEQRPPLLPRRQTQRFARVTSGQPVLSLTDHFATGACEAGDSRLGAPTWLSIREEGGARWLLAHDDVLPLPGVPHTEAWFSGVSPDAWTAELDDVVDEIARLREPLVPMPRHPVSGLPAEVALDDGSGAGVLAIWGDGSAVWSEAGARGGAPYRYGILAEEAHAALARWWDLRMNPLDDVTDVVSLGLAVAHQGRTSPRRLRSFGDGELFRALSSQLERWVPPAGQPVALTWPRRSTDSNSAATGSELSARCTCPVRCGLVHGGEGLDEEVPRR